MGTRALEVVGIAGAEQVALAVDGQLETTADHDAALFTAVVEGHLAGIGARLVALVEDLDAAAREVAPDLAVTDILAVDDLGKDGDIDPGTGVPVISFNCPIRIRISLTSVLHTEGERDVPLKAVSTAGRAV